MATGDHGNARCAARRGPTPPPPPGVTHLRASLEKRQRKRQGGRRPGSRNGRFRVRREREGSGLGLAESSGRPRVSPSVRQSVLPPVCPSRVRGRSAQPLADCSCQEVPEPSSSPKPSQSPRFPEAPQDPAERGDQAGACAEKRTGWAGPGLARWGDAWMDQLRPGAPRTSWTLRKSLRRYSVRDRSRDADRLPTVTVRPAIARRGLSSPYLESSAH